ncbi:MAG TPA: hypothetical protein VGK23_08645 [Methanomassiliicoccales archaeon]|jgi:hypothetical protein
MDDEVKMWFELVARFKEQVDRKREHNITVAFALGGLALWLLNMGPSNVDWWVLVDFLRGFSFAALVFFILALLGLNYDLSKTDKEFQEVLMGILSGRLSNKNKIEADYRERTKNMGRFIGAYNMAVERATKK